MDDLNVLIIEDDAKAAGALESVLTQVGGYKIWVVENPKRGLELAQGTAFAVALTELRFAGMNGADVARAMTRVSRETAVVVITATSFISFAVEAMEAGAYGYITKPFNPAEVRIVVRRAAERFTLLGSQTDKKQFAELSVKDGLTGIYNHRYFKMCLSNRLSTMKPGAEPFSLLMSDLDDFKKYNDTKGHLAGDELLRKVSKVLKDSLRQGDLVFRYGGEEFVALLDRTDKKGAALVAERVRTLVNLYTPVTVSIGVSSSPEDSIEGEGLIAKADAALYQAKSKGKNQVCLA